MKIYSKKLEEQSLLSSEESSQEVDKFKVFLEKEFEESKNYKQEMKWFDGVWSRFRPGLGKDKRGKSGVDKKILLKTGKKINIVAISAKNKNKKRRFKSIAISG